MRSDRVCLIGFLGFMAGMPFVALWAPVVRMALAGLPVTVYPTVGPWAALATLVLALVGLGMRWVHD